MVANDFFLQEFKQYVKHLAPQRLGRPLTKEELHAVGTMTVLPTPRGFSMRCNLPTNELEEVITNLVDGNAMAMYLQKTGVK